ncbi:hypothetical protein MAIT1_02300 [Magnetofaba australis IT-1]|uniref:Glycosyltransferase n=1 Tax=Magnetofaba australis IT-1 TaxID=1434232 RepID=A0A1Y2K3E7_9PROT|nr:hypothetical protein MAIT1_02300 [Magnetofaba australis IT-1]
MRLWCAPNDDDPLFQQLFTDQQSRAIQCAGDLGARLAHAARQELAEADAVLLLGADAPAVDPSWLAWAVEMLARRDAALIPAEDGGYTLLGLKRAEAALFTDMEWGGDQVAAQTRARIQALGWSWAESAPLWDVDTPDDWARFCASRAPHG